MDATVGNGHDTAFLAELVGPSGEVYGFDIQQQAIEAAHVRLQEAGTLDHVRLIQDGHETIPDYLPVAKSVQGAVFNLGYLPGADKSVITLPDTTLTALKALMKRLTKGGIIVLVVYHGHPGGANERDALRHFTQRLPQSSWHVLEYGFTNQINHPPFIIALEKKRNLS
ncbi:SAM-dependent methyltransferase, MraW methylase family [Salisediminibacterium beveridgei]|uniref:SAM-dependent methyltransferase, MraW methylase family n=1 Tax=Salisediminibacterium beveridgei TaxID=632773 RepID=A0A1D7QSW4_9BACI|nr:SAM-dependent methyltransferase, MraW methylase family [Salisediminibacterium beveridgei]